MVVSVDAADFVVESEAVGSHWCLDIEDETVWVAEVDAVVEYVVATVDEWLVERMDHFCSHSHSQVHLGLVDGRLVHTAYC